MKKAFSVKLKLIGYWDDKLRDGSLLGEGSYSDDYALYPSPMELTSPGWLGTEKSNLVSYLRSGGIKRQYCGWSTCRFLCENKQIGGRELTDGVWVWPDGLAHYVEVHDVLLPDEFVNHARNNRFAIPTDVIETSERRFGDKARRPNLLIRIFRIITASKWSWYRKSYDKSFWIQWRKNVTNRGEEYDKKDVAR